MIKCVTFDLDDTIWAVQPVMRAANHTLWSWLETHTPEFTQAFEPADLVEGSAIRRQLISEQPEIGHSMTLIRKALISYGLTKVGYSQEKADEMMEQAYDTFIRARHDVTLFEHARDMLQTLRSQGYILGALSNGNADVKLTGAADLFDFQFNADMVGSAKPDAEMFEAALHHTGLRPEQVVHIGDHPINDVKGAMDAGLWTLWVNLSSINPAAYPWSRWPEAKRADIEVTSLQQIPAAIEEICKRAETRATL